MKKIYTKIITCALTGLMSLSTQAQKTEPVAIQPQERLMKVSTYEDSTSVSVIKHRTGAIFTLSGKELQRMMVGNLLNTLQGRIPGLTVVTGSGEPGYDNPTLYLRGQSSWNIAGNRVVIYLDGFEVDLNAISSLSPYEIESITLFKDAVALSQFGLQGGAGVLWFKTVSGNVNDKIKITANARYGIQSVIDLPQVMNAYDYTTHYNMALQNDGLPVKYPNTEAYKANNDPFHPNVDWYKEMLKNTSTIQDYNLSFRGGGERARYFVLMNYTDFTGLYNNATAIDKDFGTNARYNKINLRGNVDLQLSKNLSVTANITAITEDKNTPAGFTATQLFDNLLRTPASAFPVVNPNGSWGISSAYNFNPVQRLQRFGIWNSHTRNLQTNMAFTEKLDVITSGLALKGGISFSNQYVGFYQKQFSVPAYEINKDANDQPVLDGDGNVVYIQRGNISETINEGETSHWNRNTFQIGLEYNRTFGKSTYNAGLLAKRQNYSKNGLVYQLRHQALSGSFSYDYDNTYLFDVAASYNGSTDFAPGNRYGFFPSVGLGWVLSNESFLSSSNTVDHLKLRATWGKVGNDNEAYRFLYQQWAAGGGGWTVGSDNIFRGGRREGAVSNAAFGWETKTILNLGIDITVLKKLKGTVDLFSEKRTGILERPDALVPGYTGFLLQFLNTGEVQNKGFEISLAYEENEKAFRHYLRVSAAFARNKITKRSEAIQPYDYLYSRNFRLDQFKGLAFDGFYQESDFDATGILLPGTVSSSYATVKPGDMKFKDQDGNGVINDMDKIPMGFAKLPEITLGFNLGFRYKGFDFDAFLQGVMNRTVSLLDDAYIYTHPFVNNNNMTVFSQNSWTPQTANTATYPRLSTLSNANNDQQSDFWLRNGNFFKLRSIELGYTFSLIKELDDVRVFVNGTNLFTWDKIEDLEAERLSMGYPLMRAVTLGLKVKL
ncbi:SusC/RagA family TonB-linked outer membrane protein [Gynurincola endophyticus]|uniref:SusC/RagA family TonB-linked outer membrane protein n=1 Tax=Gynurincola endophyticus TaxID=2479004 RepID=UPI0018F6FCE0|nr:SusC/RagA family TonB-linked outer membrane protein [Gynurincola endophyticus]